MPRFLFANLDSCYFYNNTNAAVNLGAWSSLSGAGISFSGPGTGRFGAPTTASLQITNATGTGAVIAAVARPDGTDVACGVGWAGRIDTEIENGSYFVTYSQAGGQNLEIRTSGTGMFEVWSVGVHMAGPFAIPDGWFYFEVTHRITSSTTTAVNFYLDDSLIYSGSILTAGSTTEPQLTYYTEFSYFSGGVSLGEFGVVSSITDIYTMEGVLSNQGFVAANHGPITLENIVPDSTISNDGFSSNAGTSLHAAVAVSTPGVGSIDGAFGSECVLGLSAPTRTGPVAHSTFLSGRYAGLNKTYAADFGLGASSNLIITTPPDFDHYSTIGGSRGPLSSFPGAETSTPTEVTITRTS